MSTSIALWSWRTIFIIQQSNSDSTGSITLPPGCVSFDVPSTLLPLSEGSTTEEVVHLPTLQPPSTPDNDPFPSIPSSPLFLDPDNHLDSVFPLSFTEGATTISHPRLSLSSIKEAYTFTPAPRCSQPSTAGRPPDWLSLLAYDTARQIHRSTLPCSTQTIFHTNSGQHLPKVTGEKQQNAYLANFRWPSFLTMCSSTKLGTLHSFRAKHQ